MDDIIPLSLTKTTLWLLALSASHFGGLEAPGSGPGRPAPAWRLAELQEHRHRCSPPPAWPRTRPQKLRAGPKTALRRWELSALPDTLTLCGAQTYHNKANRYFFYIKHRKSYFLFANGRHSAGDGSLQVSERAASQAALWGAVFSPWRG